MQWQSVLFLGTAGRSQYSPYSPLAISQVEPQSSAHHKSPSCALSRGKFEEWWVCGCVGGTEGGLPAAWLLGPALVGSLGMTAGKIAAWEERMG